MSDVLSRWNWSENGMVQEDNGPFYLCDDSAAIHAELSATVARMSEDLECPGGHDQAYKDGFLMCKILLLAQLGGKA